AKYEYDYLTNYDFDEFILPRKYPTSKFLTFKPEKESKCNNSIEWSLKQDSYNIVKYANSLLAKYGPKSAFFEFSDFQLLEDFEQIKKKLLSLENNEKLIYNKSSTFFTIDFENLAQKKLHENQTRVLQPFIDCLNKSIRMNKNVNSKWNNLYGIIVDNRQGKSIFLTNNTLTIHPHSALSIRPFTNGVKIPIEIGNAVHIRDSNTAFREKTSAIESNVKIVLIIENNRIEGFHSGLNKMITSYHPNIFVLHKQLKVQQDCSLVDYTRIQLGQKGKEMSKKNKDKELGFELIKVQYKYSNNIDDYLLALCQLIQYPYEYWFDSEGAIDNDEDTTIEQSSEEQECGNHDQEILYAQLGTIHDLPDLTWQSNQMNVQAENRQTRSTPSIAQFLYTLDEDPEEPHFNYIRSLMNHETLDAMSNAKKAEEERNKQLTDEYTAAITSKNMEDEVKRMWRSSGSESRKRISKKDRDAAMFILRKKVAEKVEVQLASEFLNKYGETQSYL
ncbi:hypothetical protein BpHYR1_051420, partial [Brachionus plicatilis]